MLSLLLCATAFAQGWGRREAMRPWLEGKFTEAEAAFARARAPLPTMAVTLLWEADFETERGRLGRAAALIRQAEQVRTSESVPLIESRRAALLLAAGRFAEARQILIDGQPWDGRNASRVKHLSPVSLVAAGEIALAAGDHAIALEVFARAAEKAKNPNSVYGFEWVRAEIGRARALLHLGSTQAAVETAAAVLAAAEAKWGPSGVPALDAADVWGLALLQAGDLDQAELALDRSRVRREALYGANHRKVSESYRSAARLRVARGANHEAVTFVRRALAIERALTPSPSGQWAVALIDGAAILARAGEMSEALELCRAALPVLEKEASGGAAARVRRTCP